jgi:hypothetical protein
MKMKIVQQKHFKLKTRAKNVIFLVLNVRDSLLMNVNRVYLICYFTIIPALLKGNVQ